MSKIADWVKDPSEYEGLSRETLINRCEMFRNQKNALLLRLAALGDERAIERVKRLGLSE